MAGTTFRIDVIVNPTGAVTGTKAVRTELQKTNTVAKGLGATLLKTFAGIGLIVGIGTSIRLLADYTQAMSTVQAVTGATAEQFEALDQKAQDLGRNTRFTATQAADAMVLLARAGFTAEESLGAVEGTLNLAQAGALGLEEAAGIAASTLRGFRLEVDQTARVVDVLTLAANSANTNVSQLGEGLKFAAPIAAGLGVSLEETTAIIGALSDAGLQATLAGTGLRRVMSELESPSKKTADILRDVGLTTDDVRISEVGLTTALKRLADAGLDTGQALEVFGDRGGPAFEVISSSIPKVELMTAKLNAAEGTASAVSKVMDDNLNGALLRLKSAFEGLVLGLGTSDTAMGGLVGVIEGLAAGMNYLTDNVEALGASLGILTVGLITVKVLSSQAAVAALASASAYVANAAAATALTFSIGGLTSVLTGATIALRGMLAALAANPFGLIVIGAAAAYTSIQALNEVLDALEDKMKFEESGKFLELTEFARLGEMARDADKEVAKLRARIESGDANPQLLQQMEQLEEKAKRFRLEQEVLAGKTDKARQAAQEQALAVAELGNAFSRSKEALLEEGRLLGHSNREREVQIALLQELQRIQKEGGPQLTGAERAELEQLIRKNQEYADQAAVLDRLRGPQERLKAEIAALTVLQQEGTISTKEFNDELLRLTQGAGNVDLSSLGIDLDKLGLEVEGFDLEKFKALLAAAQGGTGAAGPVQGPPVPEGLGDQPLPTTGGLSPELQLQQQLYQSIKGPQQEFAAVQAQLKQLLDDSAISAEEYAIALNDARIATTDISTSMGAGFSAGLAQIQNQLLDVSGTISDTLVSGFNAAEDALVQFVRTGEADFSSFVNVILDGLAKLLVQQALLALFGGEGGGGGGGGVFGSLISGFFGGGKATGGNVSPGKSYLVGEEGKPELFTPSSAGRIIPAGETAAKMQAGQQPEINVSAPPAAVQVINVSDPDEVPRGIESAKGEQAIMNVISRNRRTVKGTIG